MRNTPDLTLGRLGWCWEASGLSSGGWKMGAQNRRGWAAVVGCAARTLWSEAAARGQSGRRDPGARGRAGSIHPKSDISHQSLTQFPDKSQGQRLTAAVRECQMPLVEALQSLSKCSPQAGLPLPTPEELVASVRVNGALGKRE